jgi:hypothetical protein
MPDGADDEHDDATHEAAQQDPLAHLAPPFQIQSVEKIPTRLDVNLRHSYALCQRGETGGTGGSRAKSTAAVLPPLITTPTRSSGAGR